jgi:hypothetical protein
VGRGRRRSSQGRATGAGGGTAGGEAAGDRAAGVERSGPEAEESGAEQPGTEQPGLAGAELPGERRWRRHRYPVSGVRWSWLFCSDPILELTKTQSRFWVFSPLEIALEPG